MSRRSPTRQQRRASVQARLSFPDEDVEQARRFVEAGSLLEDCPPRRAVFRNPFVRRRSLSHYSVDASWQYLQEAATPSAPSTRKWHFADMTVVNPIIKDDVRLSRLSGVNALNKLKGRSDLEFQMVHGRRRVKFRAGTREEVRLWVTALQSYLVERGARSAVDQFSDMAQGHFQKADSDDDGGLSFQEVELMLKNCNMRPSEEHLGKIFKIFDKDNNLAISEEEFPDLFCMLLGKTHLREIFNTYCVEGVSGSCGQRVMPFSEFVRFTQEVQGGVRREESSRSLFGSLSEPFIVPEADALTETGFNILMSSKTNSILDPERSRLYQDMSQPLSHYWINCSHNTYLEGAQIAGTASVEQYLEVLSQGCRCVEIDLWDGPNGQPMVTHGYTLSSKLLFEEVVQALQDHAFDHSDFPLILSLENHCSKEQVVRVGQILVEVFGDRLLRHQEGFEGQPLVSPEAARRRVLVKGSLVHIPGLEEVPLSEESRNRHSSKFGIASAVYTRVKSMTSSRSSVSMAGSLRQVDLQLGIQQFNSVIYLVSRKHRSLTEERQSCNISSFSETRAIRMCRKHGQDLNAYHRDNLSRIFPPGQNVGSTNLAPLLHWVHGAQLVALNFQKMDTSVLLNEGVFREHNGGFGYVLKPDAVLAPGEGREPQELKLNITVLSAHFLPRPEGVREESLVTSPLVVISVHGLDGEPVQQETRPAKHDGFSPTWEETFEFQVTREDVSIITFEVFHQDAKLSSRAFVAQAAYPVSGLRAGVRWVPLWDHGRRSVPNCGILAKVGMERQGGPPAAAAAGALAAAAACAPPRAGQGSAQEPELYSSEGTSLPEDSELLGDMGSMQIYRNHVSM